MQTITNFTSNGKIIGAEFFQPTTAPNGGVIIIAYGSDGMVDNEHGPWATMIRGYAGDLASKGFAAVVPDYFQSTNTHAGDIDFQNGGALQIARHRDGWLATLIDAVAFAQSLPGVSPARTGLLGFSLGGHLCLRARAKAKVLVEFFAPILDGLGANTAPLQAQIHHGEGDKLVTFADNAQIIDRDLRAEHTPTELCRYKDATHGFSGSDASNTSARTLSKARTLAFFQTHL